MTNEEIRMRNAQDYFKSVFIRTDNTKVSQCEHTLEYLKEYGSITPLEALNAFNCMRLGARIADLRKAGWHIRTETHKGGKAYAIYSLE